MVYSVKEIFKTLQGEGSQAGRTAVFCRFSGCNLWSGREQDRAGAQCTFCDTDFVGTNGTLPAPEGIDWICVSPKAGNTLVQTRGNELKLVYPQPGIHPSQFEHLDFEQFWLQPMDNPLQRANTEQAIAYCLEHPRWRLSTQTPNMIGIR